MLLTLFMAALSVSVFPGTEKANDPAVKELKHHLTLLTGETPVSVPYGEGMFVIGARPEGAAAAGSLESRYQVKGGKVYFWGDRTEKSRDGKKFTAGYDGTLYAVYLFLSKELGFRWIYPGEEGVVSPARVKDYTPREGASGTYSPHYNIGRMRSVNVANTVKFHLPLLNGKNVEVPVPIRHNEESAKKLAADVQQWYKRNLNFSRDIFPYGHAFIGWQERFVSTRPELLALDAKGVRGNTYAPHRVMLCVSNDDVVDQIIADWKAEGAPLYLNVCQNDGGGLCRCDKCAALDADLPGEKFLDHKTDRYVNFYNRIAEKAIKVRPDAQVVTYIYSFYRHPPRRERIAYPDNMIFGTVPTFADDWRTFYAGWKKAGMKKFFLRPNFHCSTESLPRGVEKMLYDVFSYCRDNGMIGVDYCAYMGRFSTLIENYFAVRLISEPRLSFEEVMAEYCGAYGEAAGAVDEYFRRIRERREKSDETVRIQAGKRNMLDDSQHAVYQLRPHTEEALLGDLAVLEAALKAGVTSPAARKRLETLVIRARQYVLVYRFLSAGQGKDKDVLRKAAKELIDYRVAHPAELLDTYSRTMNTRIPGTETHTWLKVPEVLSRQPAPAPGVTVALELEPGPENPRNSEGAFIQLKDGRIMFAYTRYRGGSKSDHAKADIAARYSSDKGVTWTREDEIIVKNHGGMNVMSVSLLRLKSGEIAMFYLLKNSITDCRPVMRRSFDEGKTWTEPTMCITDEVRYFVLNNDRVIQLRDGRLLFAVARHGLKNGRFDGAGGVLTYFSDDNGVSWRRGKSFLSVISPSGKIYAAQEPGVVECSDGSVLLWMRTTAGCQFMSRSVDRGETWTAPQPSWLRSPCSPASIKRLPSGELLAVWNDHENVKDGTPQRKFRRPFTCALSDDDGYSWYGLKTIESDPQGWFCYTAVEPLDDGSVLLGYCAYWKLSLSRIVKIPGAWFHASDCGNIQDNQKKQKIPIRDHNVR